MHHPAVLTFSGFVLALAACGLGNDGAEADAGHAVEFDEWRVLPAVTDGAYLEEGFVTITGAPFPSAVGESTIRVYVSELGWSDYLAADPDIEGSGANLPVGTVIVREVLDAQGAVETLTVMARGEPGYSPGNGDFWYAVLEPDGFPRFEGGEPLMGQLVQACASCHLGRSDDGFLFGVKREHRRPELPARGTGSYLRKH